MLIRGEEFRRYHMDARYRVSIDMKPEVLCEWGSKLSVRNRVRFIEFASTGHMSLSYNAMWAFFKLYEAEIMLACGLAGVVATVVTITKLLGL